MSVKELEEGVILDDSVGNSDDEGEVKEVSHIDIYSIEKSIMPNNNNQSNDPLYTHRNRFLIENVGKKLFVKYTKFFLSEDEIDLVLKQAALEWCLLKMRQTGHGGV